MSFLLLNNGGRLLLNDGIGRILLGAPPLIVYADQTLGSGLLASMAASNLKVESAQGDLEAETADVQ